MISQLHQSEIEGEEQKFEQRFEFVTISVEKSEVSAKKILVLRLSGTTDISASFVVFCLQIF
jgi:hypothetical protein